MTETTTTVERPTERGAERGAARDLHDSVKQQVFATSLHLGAAQVRWEHDPAAARRSLRRSRGAGPPPSSVLSTRASTGPTGWKAAWSAARCAKTKHSSSEFEASRFAPCTPVQATSPQA